MAVRFKLPSYEHPHFIREWRLFRGLSQDKLVDRTGISKTTISRLENYGQPYSQDLLEAIAAALDTNPASLIGRDPNNPDDVLALWNQVPAADRPQALRMLRGLAEPHEKAA